MININSWYTDIDIYIPSTPDKHNDITYTLSTIQGRLNITEEKVQLPNGETVIAKAKLFTNEILALRTKIDTYLIISKKPCKNKSNTICFYKYYLR